jgi:O-acetyl-ADP-ribose deacetylase (regulator of RNase III)
VIHTVGPVWHGGARGESELLASAYRSSLAIAQDEGLRTVAFPAISTGVFGYPLEPAARLAIGTVREVVEREPDAFAEVRFVVFSAGDEEVYDRVLASAAR